MTKLPFKVSTGLKDLIGRELITDDFVAVFELVKNAFDAHAKRVRIIFEADRIVIADNGKGMSRKDIAEKWLFVAYSAKREGIEDADYRSRIIERRAYAGAKGVGRFSCDRLGAGLTLVSIAAGHAAHQLTVDWSLFEQDPTEEFTHINLDLTRSTDASKLREKPAGPTGTILQITELRAEWPRPKLQALKRELTKLIDPFSGGSSKFRIEIVAPSQRAEDKLDEAYNASLAGDKPPRLIVNGLVENPIIEALARRTTTIKVRLIDDGASLETILEDRGELIYKIREPNIYSEVADTELSAEIYYLNRSAKTFFTYRMGLPAVQFGSIFVFRNGFRVFPIGAEDDDFFQLNRRKQQGQRRFLGGRDLIGRIDILGVDGFNEATSRNQGLIETPGVLQLIELVRDKCVRRLERYVVDISWRDKEDQHISDTSRIKLDDSSARVAGLVSKLAATEGVELLDYNPDIVRIVDEKSAEFELSLKSLEIIADELGDRKLAARLSEAKERVQALRRAEQDAREAERRADSRAAAAETAAAKAEALYSSERERNQFLVAAASLDEDTILNLHHQIIIHAADVQYGIKRMMGRLRGGATIQTSEWTSFLDLISYRNNQILTAARFATKGGYKQQSSEVETDLLGYIRDYVETISTLWAPRGLEVSVRAGSDEFRRRFKPIEVGIVIDNIVSNAAKARAGQLLFVLHKARGTLRVIAADDGAGWSDDLHDLRRVFDKGVTTTNGSGLGLSHVKQVVEGMGGTVEALAEPYSDDLDGAQIVLNFPS